MIVCRLNRLRVEKGDIERRKLTLRSVAAESGVSYGSVQRLAANKAQQVEFQTLEKLCLYFRCQVGDLIEHRSIG